MIHRRLMREAVEEPYDEAATWGQAVKGDEAFADRALQEAGGRRLCREALRRNASRGRLPDFKAWN